MQLAFLAVGFLLALMVLAASLASKVMLVRKLGAVVALTLVIAGFIAGSIVFVGASSVGIVTKNAFGKQLAGGKIIATEGEMGVQAGVLPPGWHLGYWPLLYNVSTVPLVQIKNDEVGLIETADGMPLPAGQLFAPEFSRDQVQKMLDAEYFLSTGKGCKGKQTTVLTPGSYRLNTELFKVRSVKQTEVKPGEVAVLKSNFGTPPTSIVHGIAGAVEPGADGEKVEDESKLLRLAKDSEMGILAVPLPPGKYPLNTDAFSVTEIWTTQMIAHYTAANAGNPVSPQLDGLQRKTTDASQVAHAAASDERDIRVITSDGFNFPVDVRIEYFIEPANAPLVVAKLGDDEGERFRNALNSAVRAIFRNNAENVKALDYVQQRSHQETQSLTMLKHQMARFGVSVTAVRIGNVGDRETLGKLLDTQTQREIAKQELLTTIEQQKAAEQKKELSRITQESEEEKKLATATYSVRIAQQSQKQRVVEAEAEAQAVQIRAKAQADAVRVVAEQIGKPNASLLELLKIVGERNIQITPRVMISGGAGGETGTALVGTVLDAMLAGAEERDAKDGKK